MYVCLKWYQRVLGLCSVFCLGQKSQVFMFQTLPHSVLTRTLKKVSRSLFSGTGERLRAVISCVTLKSDLTRGPIPKARHLPDVRFWDVAAPLCRQALEAGSAGTGRGAATPAGASSGTLRGQKECLRAGACIWPGTQNEISKYLGNKLSVSTKNRLGGGGEMMWGYQSGRELSSRHPPKTP